MFSFAALFSCITAGRASDVMNVPTLKFLLSWVNV